MPVNKKKSDTSKVSNFYGRISIDLPPELYDVLKKNTKRKGQTLRGYVVNLIAEDFDFDLYKDDN